MEKHELVIIGGGSAGIGATLAALACGVRPVLIESAEALGSATSHQSLRIIHGGFRYIQHLNLTRVYRSARAQHELREIASGYLRELPCLMPLKKWGLRSSVPVRIAQGLYRAICGRAALPGRILSCAEAERAEPILQGGVPYGALLWTDLVMTDPGALVADLQHKILRDGGQVRTNSRVVQVEQSRDGCILTLQTASGSTSTILARRCIEALGPGFGSLPGSPAAIQRTKQRWVKAFNVVVPGSLVQSHGVGIQSGGRLFFGVPRGDSTAFGTAYLPWLDGQPIAVTAAEKEYFLARICGAYGLPNSPSMQSLTCDVGILPASSIAGWDSQPCGSEKVFFFGAYTAILSTKYTTFLTQGRRAVQLSRAGKKSPL